MAESVEIRFVYPRHEVCLLVAGERGIGDGAEVLLHAVHVPPREAVGRTVNESPRGVERSGVGRALGFAELGPEGLS